MKKALIMAIAVLGLAIPTFAIAESEKGGVFTHDGEPVTGDVPVEFAGTAQFELEVAEEGVHCAEIDVHAVLGVDGTGEVKSFEGTGCKTFPDGFPTHATAKGLPWEIEAGPEGQATINDIEIHNSVRHPATTHEEIGTTTLTGHVKADIGGTDAVLSNDVGAVKVNHLVNANVDGELTITETDTEGHETEDHTDIGTE